MPASIAVDSSQPFVYTACAAYLDSLQPGEGPAAVLALRPREPDFLLFTLAASEGTVTFRGSSVNYCVETSAPLASDAKPEPYRRLVLTADTRELALDLVLAAVERHRRVVTAPRGNPGAGVMRYVWDDGSQCWDSGKLVPPRSLDTLFLPEGVAEALADDLQAYLKPETRDRYAALHVAPVRVYMLQGTPGSGKSATVHCLASATGNNLATLNFRDHTSDEDVAAAIRCLPPSCFLCIEDVDCLFDARANKNHGVSFASLLAALDGGYGVGDSSSGPLTVFMTTNRMDALDPALRRRVDYAVEFGWATKQQCRRMFAAFFPDHPGFDSVWLSVSRFRFTMSVFQKFLVRCLNRGDPLELTDVFETLVHCAYGSATPGSGSMYC